MGIVDACIKKPVTTFMIVIALVVVGFVSLGRLPIDLFPSIDVPISLVMTTYEGAGPEEVESLITKPLEGVVSSVSNLKDISSISSQGMSVIILQFNEDVDMEMAALNVREKIDLIKNYLPNSASTPMVYKMDLNQMPIMQIGISSDTMDLTKLKTFTEDNVQNRLERINGVASVSLSGGKTEEILVTLIPEKLQGFGITTSQISQLLSIENLNLPAGQLMQGDSNITIRTMGEFKNIEEIRNLPITTQSGVIYLRDVATVERKFKDISSYSFINGKPSVSLSIQKQSVANTVEIAAKINEELANLGSEYEGMIEIKMIMDNSEYINNSINNLVSSALSGALLAVIVIYVFLRNFGSTLIIAVSIPTSIMVTFILMYFNGISLNMISLGALTLGVGMLVDNSIVVIENIYRHKAMGKSPKQASSDGAKEVAMAITASTLTSVAVFLPFIFTEGMITKVFHELAWIVTYSLSVSLVVALTIVPVLASMLIKDDDVIESKPKKKLRVKYISNLFDKLEEWIEKLEESYTKVLDVALKNKKKTLYIVGAACVVGIFVFIIMTKEYFPSSDEGIYTVNITLPKGKVIEETLNTTDIVVGKLGELSGINDMFVSVGSDGGVMSLTGGGTNSASITVDIGPTSGRRYSIDQAMDMARETLSDVAGCEIVVSASSSSNMTSSEPISIEITGDDIETLQLIADDMIDILNDVEGVREPRKSSEKGDLEARVVIDRTKMSQYALTTAQVAQAIQLSIQGSSATKFKVDGREIDVTVKTDDTNVKYIKDLSNIYVESAYGVSVPLPEIGQIEINNSPSNIERSNQKRIITITSKLSGVALGNAQSDIDAKLRTYAMPEGYTYKWGGDSEEMTKTFNSLGTALMLAIMLIYMVLASQFESLLNPFIIMFAVPLALIASIFGLFITGQSLNIIGILGFIILSGIVVNNAIVLIEFIIQERERGTDRMEAVRIAGRVRRKPILMTTLTTALGMVPMAIGGGEGMDLTRSMAIVIIFGLVISTLLTLIVIPIVYLIFDDLKEKSKRNKKIGSLKN